MRGGHTLVYLRASCALTEANPWRDRWLRLQEKLGPACVSRSVPSPVVARICILTTRYSGAKRSLLRPAQSRLNLECSAGAAPDQGCSPHKGPDKECHDASFAFYRPLSSQSASGPHVVRKARPKAVTSDAPCKSVATTSLHCASSVWIDKAIF